MLYNVKAHSFHIWDVTNSISSIFFLEFCDVGCQIGPPPEEGLIMRNVECQTELMVLKCEHIEAEREEQTSGVINTVRDFFSA